MSSWRKLGVIAGGGELPVLLAEHCVAEKRSYFVARVSPYASDKLDAHPGATHGLGEIGARIEALKAAGVDAIVVIGQIPRPDLRNFHLDARGQAMLPQFLAAAGQGDDALMRVVLEEHEREGFRIVGAEEVMAELLAPPGPWGVHAPTPAQLRDIVKGARIAAAIGTFDVGQGVVVCEGLVLAVEAQEGTDQMLARVATLPAAVRGTVEARRGVLVKRPKPIQERRIDLPTIGMKTVEGAANGGLAGIAVEAYGALAVGRAGIVAEAERMGLFVYGFTRAEAGEI